MLPDDGNREFMIAVIFLTLLTLAAFCGSAYLTIKLAGK